MKEHLRCDLVHFHYWDVRILNFIIHVLVHLNILITLFKVFERQTQWTLCPIYSYMCFPTTYNYIYQSLRGWSAVPHTDQVNVDPGITNGYNASYCLHKRQKEKPVCFFGYLFCLLIILFIFMNSVVVAQLVQRLSCMREIGVRYLLATDLSR